jgi:hypothetical protein
MTEKPSWQQVAERSTPTILINPRFVLTRLPNWTYVLHIYQRQEKDGKPITTHYELPVNSRAAHELFDELVNQLSQEEGGANARD